MHVLHVSNSIMAGGAELHLLTLCRGLAARSVRQTVAYLHDRPVSRSLKDEFEDAGVSTRKIPANGRYNVTFPLAVDALVRALRPDLLHTHLPRADLAGVFVKFRHHDLPWVVSVHNIYTTRSWTGSAALPLLDVAWRNADTLIAISHAVRDWLVGGRGIPAGRVRVVHYGIDPSRFLVPHPDARARWGLPDSPVVAAIGRLTLHKGFATLIDAWRQVHARLPEAVLVIAGWDVGGYRRELETQVAANGLDSNVRLLGFVDDVPELLAACDVFVLPSTSEGFGQVVIEAMASAKPVVVSRIPPLTEIVIDGETGLLVPPGTPNALSVALISLFEAGARAAQLGAHGRARVLAEFSAEHMAEQTMAVYAQVMASRRT